MKKLLCLVLGIALLLSVAAGCGAAPDNAGGENGLPASSAQGADTPADLSPITFTVYIGDAQVNADNWESPVAKEITKKTGVTLQIEYVVSGDEKQKISLMAASGDYPDLIMCKNSTHIMKDVGGLQKLDELIDQYGPNVKRFYGDYFSRLKYSKDDPSIYILGGYELNKENMEPDTGFELQHAVVKALGYPKIRTVTDYENAIKAYLEKNPTIDGQKTIGLSLLADDWRALISVTNPACFATGGSDDGEWYVNQEDMSVIRHLLRPEEREYFRWLNHMNAEGLLDPESFVQKYDQYKAKIATGRVLGLIDARWEVGEPITALRQAGKEDRMYGWYPVTMNENIKFPEYVPTGYRPGYGISITTKCRDTKRAMEFLDWFHTEEAQILTHWGVEGVHYDIVDGKRVMKDEFIEMQKTDPQFSKKTGITLYEYPFPQCGNMVLDSNGQSIEAFATLDAIKSRQTSVENEVLKAYGVTCWKELYPQSSEFKPKPYAAAWLISMDDSDYTTRENKIQQLGYKMIPAAILAKPSDFDAKWDAFIKAIKDAGVEENTKMFEARLKTVADLWK
jgi:putative aldouronate transport system substrate-binding protein